MTESCIIDVLSLQDAAYHAGANPSSLEDVDRYNQFILPEAHRKLLLRSNGIESYGNYFRIFGVGSEDVIDVNLWNRRDYWKFAWGGRCDKYWCFAENAWGDQYAYMLGDGGSAAARKVYLLDCLSMNPQIIADSFEDFIAKEFLRISKEPYDFMIRLAREKFGDIMSIDHIVYAPSILMGGEEIIDNVHLMNARVSMIINGDVATQVDSADAGSQIDATESYVDEQGRARLRLIWK